MSQNEFPKMLYKAGGHEHHHGAAFSTHIVHSADEQDEAMADGWHETTPAAIDGKRAEQERAAAEAAEAAQAAADAEAEAKRAELKKTGDEDTKPTRAQLEDMATELGVEFPPNLGDKKLIERIEAKRAELKKSGDA